MLATLTALATKKVAVYAGMGVAGAVTAFVLKKIPNEKICAFVEKTFESVGRVCTLNLARWDWSKKYWGTVEAWLIDAIDNIFGSIVRGLIKGLKSDNK